MRTGKTDLQRIQFARRKFERRRNQSQRALFEIHLGRDKIPLPLDIGINHGGRIRRKGKMICLEPFFQSIDVFRRQHRDFVSADSFDFNHFDRRFGFPRRVNSGHTQAHGLGLVVLPCGFKMSLRVLAQFVKTFHRAFLNRRQIWDGNQPAEFRNRPLIFDLQNQILAPGAIHEDGLLRRFVDVLVFVPDKFWRDEHPVGLHFCEASQPGEARQHQYRSGNEGKRFSNDSR